MEIQRKNYLRCPQCGFAIITSSTYRDCAKCETKMKEDWIK